MKVKNTKELHKYVCADGICEVCELELPLNMLCSHHIKTKGSRPDLKLETTNCICVCNTPNKTNNFAGCHNAIHNGKIKI